MLNIYVYIRWHVIRLIMVVNVNHFDYKGDDLVERPDVLYHKIPPFKVIHKPFFLVRFGEVG